MNPILYDFKRSFLRLSVIIFLVLFAVVGIGIGYLTYHITLANLPQSSYYNMNFAGVTSGDNTVEGYIFNNQGNPLSATVELLNEGKVISTTQSNSSGFFVIQGNNATCILVKYSTYDEKAVLPPSGIVYNVSKFYNYFIYRGDLMAVILGVKGSVGKLVLVSTSEEGSLNLTFYNEGLKSICSHTINYSSYITVTTLKVPPGTELISIAGNLLHSRAIAGRGAFRISCIYYPIPYVEDAINQGVSSSSSLFLEFFPIIMIYLAYVLYSKLIDSGAIEFIISRPLTRTSFYLTRLGSGILTGIVTSIIFSVIVGATFSVLVHYFPAFVVTMLIVELISVLSFYYILAFMLSNFIKSATATLGISIALFFIIRIVEGILPIFLPTSTTNILAYYINPTSICAVASYLSTHLTLVCAPFNVGISIALQLVWLVGLSALGYLKFRRTDL
ncbi:ABC transporter permease subunit [Acidianus sp. HS-5]|uniref:ABC transporter permease subunit n=1 Tax=Acidianus sp. HS-5 TaxID=2886040 RepID=UPI001F29BB25|nr:ABC transporter permease subunit [Acidianus sp. HS-5]BDC17913.1 hypothetical protein HS5_08030 [Acidianus sp. HS-5]